MKQVNPKYYNQNYFQFQSVSPDFSKKIITTDFHRKYLEISSLLKLNTQDHICDLGCGNGDLSFLLYLKYHCQITAIDYSPDAIKICRQKKKLFQNHYPQAKISFVNKKNQSLPHLKKIKAVYLCDVVEHLYPQEIDLIFKTISRWGHPDIIVHTDNHNYLKLIQPLLDLMSLAAQKTTLKKLKKIHHFHQQRHVNLTTPSKLNKIMKNYGYNLQKIKYPKVNKKIIANQLGLLSNFSSLINISLKAIKMFPILSPSFYARYRYQTI